MRDIELSWPRSIDRDHFQRAIDAAITDCGLSVTLRGALKKFPGCLHWHVKNGRQAGTLEITLWPEERRAWFTVQSSRTALWIDEAIDRLAKAIRAGCRSKP